MSAAVMSATVTGTVAVIVEESGRTVGLVVSENGIGTGKELELGIERALGAGRELGKGKGKGTMNVGGMEGGTRTASGNAIVIAMNGKPHGQTVLGPYRLERRTTRNPPPP